MRESGAFKNYFSERVNMYARKQHYIPQFYLQGFANSQGQVWAYRHNPGTLYKTSIKDICAERDLYETSLANASEPKYVERGVVESALATLENNIAPSVRFLRGFNPDASAMEAEELWRHLYVTCVFISNLIVRNPRRIKTQRKNAEALTHRLIATDFFTSTDLIELDKLGYLSDFSKVVEFGILHSELFSLDKKSSMTRLEEVFCGMSFLLLKAPSDGEFITSSCPFTMIWLNAAADNPDMIYFPLSSSAALILKRDHNSEFFYATTSAEYVEGLNIELLARHDLWDTAIAKEKNALKICVDAFLSQSSHVKGMG